MSSLMLVKFGPLRMGRRKRPTLENWTAEVCYMVSNLTANYSISLQFHTDFDHVTLDVQQMFKVKGSKFKVTAWYNVSPAKNCYLSRTDGLGEFRLCKNYPTAEINR